MDSIVSTSKKTRLSFEVKLARMSFRRNLLAFFSAFVFLTCHSNEPAPQQPLRIYAAASMTTVLSQIAADFAAAHPQAKIEFNFAASSFLAKQIEQGAPADVFISADIDWMDYLLARDLIKKNSYAIFLNNRLVLIVPNVGNKEIRSLSDLVEPAVERIALGDWAHVPAGKYARQALEKFGIWGDVAAKCLPAMDVRAALAYVEQGNADCGIVYRTDAAISEKVRIVAELPAEIQPNIEYSLGMTTKSTHPFAQTFLDFLRSPAASRCFVEHGFIVPGYE